MECTFSEKYRMTAIHIAVIRFKKYSEYSCSGNILRQRHKHRGTAVFDMSRHDLLNLLFFLMRIFAISTRLGM
jgi:hypothetical protein